jgi:hypothetical protein
MSAAPAPARMGTRPDGHPPGDAATVALDLRTAVIGMLSLRINEPDLPWPPFPGQADRFLSKLVGLAPPADDRPDR